MDVSTAAQNGRFGPASFKAELTRQGWVSPQDVEVILWRLAERVAACSAYRN
jgi:hypothetical protein